MILGIQGNFNSQATLVDVWRRETSREELSWDEMGAVKGNEGKGGPKVRRRIW